MRLTKGQLKRIIREEYTRLQRQGLINEAMMSPSDPDYNTVAEVIMTVVRSVMFGHIHGPDAIHAKCMEEAEYSGVPHHAEYIAEKVFERIMAMGL